MSTGTFFIGMACGLGLGGFIFLIAYIWALKKMIP